LVFGSRILGQALPERITGVDLTNDLCALLNEQAGSVYLLGGNPGAALTMADKLQNIYPKLRIAGVDCPAKGFEKNSQNAILVLQKIQTACPDLLLVGFGAPKQEYWIEDNLLALPCKLVMGVGGTFDMISGQVRRAPQWVQSSGLEWLFRVCTEPRRLWKRYLFGNSYFVWVVLSQFVQQLFSGRRVRKVEVA
jgi:N-acetylglucosaminyldiphosphoundecaprenol N-acetyl-beta-D-mannosaminyltransferase